MTLTASPKTKDTVDRAIIHVDMDAFYASVEQHDHPEYQDKPVIVGGTGNRGVVAAASYEVRKFGVFSAMPMSRARRLCPHAIVLPVRMSRYREVSQAVFRIFHSITPQVEGLSLDEAFLDVTGSLALFGDIERIGATIGQQILEKTGLHASVGMAHNKYLAKLASDAGKPRGFVHVARDRVAAFLDPMPISRMWGIGKQTLPKLHRLGILTIGQLRTSDPDLLASIFGQRSGHFLALARGEDHRDVISRRREKSLSRETTFDTDINESRRLKASLLMQTESVAGRLRAHGLVAGTVQIKIRDRRFRTITRRRSLAAPTRSTGVIYQQARELLQTWLAQNPGTPVRLLGIGVSSLETARDDGAIGDSARDQKLDATLDAIRRRFGDDKASRALVNPGTAERKKA